MAVAGRRSGTARCISNVLAGAFALACLGCSTPAQRASGGSVPATAGLQKESSPSDDPSLRLHQIYIDSKGRLLDPISGNNKDVILAEEDYVTAIVQRFKHLKLSRPEIELTVFIHGGLNTFEAATNRVEELRDRMLAENKYALFISWDAGPLGNLADHLFVVRRGVQDETLGALSSPFVFLEDIARSLVRLPAAWFNIFVGHRLTGYSEDATGRAMDAIEEANQVRLHVPSEEEYRGMPKIRTWSDLKWWNPTKLVAAPLIDGFGSGTWDSLVRRTDLVLRKAQDVDYEATSLPGTAASRFFALWEKEFAIRSETLAEREP